MNPEKKCKKSVNTRKGNGRQPHCPAPADLRASQSWPWAPQHMAVRGGLPAHPPGCKWGCRRKLGHCLPHSCFWEIAQSWVIQVQPHCSRCGSKADLGRRTGASRRGDCRVGCALWVFLGGVYVLRKEGREASVKGCAISLYHQPPLLSAGLSCCSAGRASGTAGPGSWAGPWGRAGSRRLHAPRWRPGNVCPQAQG